ncbi:MAG: DUF5667 domain-containing protein [Actinomycetota bacterium]
MVRRLLVAMLIVLMGAAPASAQTEQLPDPGMLPSNGFSSFLERAAEAVGTFFTFGGDDKADRYFSLAEERLAEAQALVDEDNIDRAEATLERYRTQLGQASDWSEGLEEGESREELSTKIAEATLKHLEVLAEVYEKVPDEAKAAIERAMQASSVGHDQALQALSAEKRQEIAESGQGRIEGLNRARQEGLPVPVFESDTGPPAILPGPAEAGQTPAQDPGAQQGQAPADVPQNPGSQGQAPADVPQNPGSQGQAPGNASGQAPDNAPAGPPSGIGGGPDNNRP